MPQTKSEFHPNEILLELHADAHPHHLPHFLDLKKHLEPESHEFGIAALDQLIHRLLHDVSITRVFVPSEDLEETLKGQKVGEHYNEEEEELGMANTFLLTFDEEHLPLQKICNRLKKLPSVKDAHPNYLVETFHHFSNFDSYVNAGLWGFRATKAYEAWNIEKGISAVTIAIIDTGIDVKNEAFKGRLSTKQYDFVHKTTLLQDPFRFSLIGDFHTPDPDPTDYSGHGTQCAGIAAGRMNPKNHFSGVCPGATILPLRVFYSYQDNVTKTITDKGSEADISAAIHYAVNAGADIISMSFGGPKRLYQSAITYANQHKVCLFAACGNEGYSSATYPASDERVMAVGAINNLGSRSRLSNYGDHYQPYIVAPGEGIISTHLNNTFYHFSGTSIATPFASGAAGLMLSLAKRAGKTLKPSQVYDILGKTADSPDGRKKRDRFYGDGVLNIEAALIETAKRLSIKLK